VDRIRLAAVLVVVFLLFVVVRGEVLEGYQIPTHSMEPVLRGNPEGGDKVLVFKKTFAFREPRRWEIVVFRRENEPGIYVKRLVGMPGETLQIVDGDVLIDGRIETKPWHVQEEMLLPVYGGSLQREDLLGFWEAWGGEFEADGSAVRVEPGTVVRWRSRTDVHDSFVDDAGNWVMGANHVGDLVLDVELKAQGDAGRVRLGLAREADAFTLELPVGSGEARLRMRGESVDAGEGNGADIEVPIPGLEPLPPGVGTRLRFANIDRVVHIFMNEKELKSIPYRPTPTVPDGHRRNEAFLEVDGAGAEITRLILSRDIYYTADGGCGTEEPMVIPRDPDRSRDRFFLLGDNSARSYDSRFWGDWYEATIPHSHLIGTPVLIFWPLDRVRILD